MSQPLQPIYYGEFDSQAGALANVVLETAAAIASTANWALDVLTQANADAGLLLGPDSTVQPGGATTPGYAPMTPAQIAYYQDIYTKLRYIGSLLSDDQGSNPAAVEIVRAWSRSVGGGNQAMFPGQPGALAGVRRF